MKSKFMLLPLLLVFIFACSQGEQQVIQKEEKETKIQSQLDDDKSIKKEIFERKIVDLAALLQDHMDDEIKEFSGSSWAIAVRNIKSDYLYYYDSNNNFLGRSK